MMKKTTSATVTTPASRHRKNDRSVSKNNEIPWSSRLFVKDKLRTHERYWRPIIIANNNYSSKHTNNDEILSSMLSLLSLEKKQENKQEYIIIPDGITWRKYLRLFTKLIIMGSENNNSETSSFLLNTTTTLFHLVLLESAVELMDWRNNSPCIDYYTAIGNDNNNNNDGNTKNNDDNGNTDDNNNDNDADDDFYYDDDDDFFDIDDDDDEDDTTTNGIKQPNEEKAQPANNNNNNANTSIKIRESAGLRERNTLLKLLKEHGDLVLPFCDLSIKEEECDEWDLLDYTQMSIEERSRCALFRAGRMIHQLYYCNGNNNNNKKVVMVVEEPLTQIEKESLESDDNGIIVIPMEDLIPLLLSTDDADNTAIATTTTTTAMSSTLLWMDRIQQCQEEYKQRNFALMQAARRSNGDDDDDNNPIQEYWTQTQIEEGLRRNELFRGRLEVTKENPKEAFVTVSSTNNETTRYFINQNKGYFNRAIHHDVVICKPLPKHKWDYPIGRRRLIHVSQQQDDDDDNAKKKDAAQDNTEGSGFPTARVVAISSTDNNDNSSTSGRRQYVATMVDIPMNADENYILVIPMDVRIPKIRIAVSSKVGWSKFVNQRLLVAIDGWDLTSTYPHGRCIEILGDIGDLEVELKCLMHENQVTLEPFSMAALACLPQGIELGTDDWQILPQEISRRRDLRTSHQIFSVDPPGCQDIDDTMHAKVLPNGDIEVGVHIADVTHFVHHNSPLDKEAQKRGTTFYLVDRRFDMLPSLLSSDLCSLHGAKDRLAVSVIWTMSSDLEDVKSCWFGRTVIHNCQAMTYDQAHNILHDLPPDDPSLPVPPPLTAGAPVDSKRVPSLKKDLWILTRLARKLKQQREEVGGGVDLTTSSLKNNTQKGNVNATTGEDHQDGSVGGSELKFTLDPTTGTPIQVKPKEDKEIHNTIAELMIMANGYVATKIFETFPDSACLRIHRSVEEGRFDDLKEMLQASGNTTFDGSSNMALAKSLKEAQQQVVARTTTAMAAAKNSAAVATVINSLFLSLATRAMSEAQYICTGNRKMGVDLSHYGLGLEKYTHFTSPIRRYADIIVHKQLLAAVAKEKAEVELEIEKKDFPVVEETNALATATPLNLELVPDSNVISILHGEGLDNVNNNDGENIEDDENGIDDDGDDDIDIDDLLGDDILGDDLLDSMIDGASELALGSETKKDKETLVHEGKKDETGNDEDKNGMEDKQKEKDEKSEASSALKPYDGEEVSKICEVLNRQNRMAKASSFECQNLFISLYFRNHSETVQAVITNLRTNGFWVYVPKFDMRGPIYISDVDGNIQIDPALVGLSRDAGYPPTFGFSASSFCRKFSSGKCVLREEKKSSAVGKLPQLPSSSGQELDTYLEVTVSESQQAFCVRTLDVVTVELRCDNWDVRSRVPAPRFHLISRGKKGITASIGRPSDGNDTGVTKITTKVLLGDESKTSTNTAVQQQQSERKKKKNQSLYKQLSTMHIQPVLSDIPIRRIVNSNQAKSLTSTDGNNKAGNNDRQELMKGRIIHGNFVNPDTRSAVQEAAISAASEAASVRRANARENVARNNEYDVARNYERSTTTRTQRIAADKRHSRRSKAK